MSAETTDEIVQTYVSAWTEPNEDVRRQLLEKSWTDDGTYTDRSQHLPGREALMQGAAAFTQRHPGHRFVITSAIDQHHNVLRFGWRWVSDNGSTVMEGIDFGEVAEDGRLCRIVGFFGPLAAPEG